MGNMKKIIFSFASILVVVLLILGLKLFSEENQNKFSRAISTTLGMKNGCVEIFIGHVTPVKRFLNVEKLSTAKGTDDGAPRPYRFGYGYIDANLNGKLDVNEKKIGKVYFEVPDFAQYIYFDNKITKE